MNAPGNRFAPPPVLGADGLMDPSEIMRIAASIVTALPESGVGGLIVLCEDRARFLAALFAGLTLNRPLLLPPNRSPGALAELFALHPGAVLLCDQEQVDPEWPATWTRLVVDALALEHAPLHPVLPSEEQLVAVAHTSGSTGHPQPWEKTWRCLREGTWRAIERFGFCADSRMVATVPPQHMYGFELSVLVPLFSGAAVWRGQPFYPADIRAALQVAGEAAWLVTTPLHLRALLRSGLEWPRIAGVISATAPLDPALAAEAESTFRCPLREIYGCTETGSMASRRTVEEAAWTPYTDMHFEISESGEARVLAEWLPAPVLLSDLLSPEASGRFRLVGRRADMVNVAGKRASLADLNLRLTAIDGVIDGVFLPPEQDGDRLRAVVVAPGLDERAVLDALARQIDPVFLPRPLYFADSLPRNATGKLPREALGRLVERLEGVRRHA